MQSKLIKDVDYKVIVDEKYYTFSGLVKMGIASCKSTISIIKNSRNFPLGVRIGKGKVYRETDIKNWLTKNK